MKKTWVKKTLVALLALTMILGVYGIAQAATFTYDIACNPGSPTTGSTGGSLSITNLPAGTDLSSATYAWTVTDTGNIGATLTGADTSTPTITATSAGTVTVNCTITSEGDTNLQTKDITFSAPAATGTPGMPEGLSGTYSITTYATPTLDLKSQVTGPTPLPQLAFELVSDGGGAITLNTSTGVVTGVKKGSGQVKVINSDDTESPKRSFTTTVNVDFNASVSVSPASASIYVKGTQAVTATVEPTGSGVNWSSANTAIATVDANGLVTAKAPGTTTITATSKVDSTKSAGMSITVLRPTITLSPASVTISAAGATQTVTATLSPTDSADVGQNSGVTWTSGDSSIASVTPQGTNFTGGSATATVTGVKTGTTTLTCYANSDPAVSKTITVVVGNPTPVITLTTGQTSLGRGSATTLYIHVDGARIVDAQKDPYAYVLITRSSRRVYAEGYYSHPRTMQYYVRLDANGNGTLQIYPQYSGNVTLTAEATGAARKSITYSVSGYPTLPQTGQDFTLIYVLGACCLAAAAAWVIVYAKKKKNNVA